MWRKQGSEPEPVVSGKPVAHVRCGEYYSTDFCNELALRA